MKKLLPVVLSIFLLTACGSKTNDSMPGIGMGGGISMMTMHQADIPDEYTGLKNPISADQASLERGAKLYATNCATCHGDGGMGDGPAGSTRPCSCSNCTYQPDDGRRLSLLAN